MSNKDGHGERIDSLGGADWQEEGDLLGWGIRFQPSRNRSEVHQVPNRQIDKSTNWQNDKMTNLCCVVPLISETKLQARMQISPWRDETWFAFSLVWSNGSSHLTSKVTLSASKLTSSDCRQLGLMKMKVIVLIVKVTNHAPSDSKSRVCAKLCTIDKLSICHPRQFVRLNIFHNERDSPKFWYCSKWSSRWST